MKTSREKSAQSSVSSNTIGIVLEVAIAVLSVIVGEIKRTN